MPTIFSSPLPDVEIPDVAITRHVFRHAERLADRPAITDGATGRSLSYGELLGAILKAAGGLAAVGVGPGVVVAVLLPNMPEYGIVFHGTVVAGATVTTINPTYTAEEVAYQLRDSGTTYLVTIAQCLDVALEAARATGVEEVFVLGEALPGAPSFSDLLTADPIDQVEVETASHVAVIPYSSGTTGLPKGVELTHRNLVAALTQLESVSTVTETDVVMAVLPFFHIYGMQVLMNGVLYVGAQTVSLPRFDLAQFLEVVQDYRVTRIAAVPPIVVALAKHPMVDEYDLSSLSQIGSGAAPLSAEIEQVVTDRIGVEIVQGFGLTESSSISHVSPSGEAKRGSIGVLTPNTEARVVEPESGEDLGVDQAGELWLRGPQMLKGYLNRPPEKSGNPDADGWFHTGDIARVDADGHWYVTDRLKELIKYKGFQVAPAELEAVLLTHPSVVDAAVVGVEDEDAGELPKAYLVLRSGANATESEIMAYVASKVASYKKVRQVEFIDEIPKSAAGKILRRILRDRVAAGD